MNKFKKFTRHNFFDYAGLIVWLLIIIVEIKYLITDPSRLISYVVMFMGIGITILYIRSIVKHIKVKRKYEKAKIKLFGNDKPRKNFWYKLRKFFTLVTVIDDEVDKMLDTKDGRKIIFDIIESDKKKRKEQ